MFFHYGECSEQQTPEQPSFIVEAQALTVERDRADATVDWQFRNFQPNPSPHTVISTRLIT